MKGCFWKNIRPSDIDGAVERNGHFLFIEAKPWGADLTTGQDIMLTRLAKQPNTTVMVMFGPKEDPKEWFALGELGVFPERCSTDLNQVRLFCAIWSRFAEGKLAKK